MENLEEVKRNAMEMSSLMVQGANELKIETQAHLGLAADLNTRAKNEIKVIEAAFKLHKDNAFKAHKDLCKAEAEQLAPFKTITSILKPKIIQYQNDVEERERKEHEARVAKQRQDEAEAKKEAEERKAQEVENLMDAGDFEKAEAVMESPTQEPMAAVVPEPEKVKVAGAGTRKVRKGRVINFAKMDDDFKQIDQKAINKYAAAMGENAKATGIEFYWDTQLTGK